MPAYFLLFFSETRLDSVFGDIDAKPAVNFPEVNLKNQ